MNEQIRELARRAGQGEPFHIPPEFIEKFAKLMVQDIILIVEGYCETSPEIWGLPLDILEHYDMELPENDTSEY